MSLLSYTRLLGLVEEGVIEGSHPDLVNASSIDIRLGNKILREVYDFENHEVQLNKRGALCMEEVDITDRPYILEPDQFILAQSLEVFNLPNYISAEYKLKSSMARIGLEHLNAGWCDAGWHGSVLTLELRNMTQHHSIVLCAGDKIGQIVFFEHEAVPDHASYAIRGSYNKDRTVSGVKIGAKA